MRKEDGKIRIITIKEMRIMYFLRQKGKLLIMKGSVLPENNPVIRCKRKTFLGRWEEINILAVMLCG